MADDWERVVSLPGLEAGEVQVWRIDLAEATEAADVYKQHLSEGERQRAERFRAGEVRMQFVVGRAGLRGLLGNLMGVPPGSVPIALSAFGKPETPPTNGGRIFFNVAHSRGTILIALCREGSVGVDLEYFDRTTDSLEVARSSFTGDEFRQITEIADPAARQRAFFGCWTRKEAVVKADGRGLSLPLTAFEVPVGMSAQSTLVEVQEDEASGRSARWFVSDLELGDEIAGAFATAVSGGPARTFHLPSSLISSVDTKA